MITNSEHCKRNSGIAFNVFGFAERNGNDEVTNHSQACLIIEIIVIRKPHCIISLCIGSY